MRAADIPASIDNSDVGHEAITWNFGISIAVEAVGSSAAWVAPRSRGIRAVRNTC